MLSLRLAEAATTERPLEEVMDELSRRALERGLTQEKLDEILNTQN